MAYKLNAGEKKGFRRVFLSNKAALIFIFGMLAFGSVSSADSRFDADAEGFTPINYLIKKDRNVSTIYLFNG